MYVQFTCAIYFQSTSLWTGDEQNHLSHELNAIWGKFHIFIKRRLSVSSNIFGFNIYNNISFLESGDLSQYVWYYKWVFRHFIKRHFFIEGNFIEGNFKQGHEIREFHRDEFHRGEFHRGAFNRLYKQDIS